MVSSLVQALTVIFATLQINVETLSFDNWSKQILRSQEKKNVRGVYMESHAASILQVRRVGGGAFASMSKADLQMSFPLNFWAVLVSMWAETKLVYIHRTFVWNVDWLFAGTRQRLPRVLFFFGEGMVAMLKY